jgi:hypothetical protein
LSKLVKVTKVLPHCVVCNFSDLIEKNMDKLKEADLFIDYDIDCIMSDFDNIISGYVSENWLEKFVNCLNKYLTISFTSDNIILVKDIYITY